ncbi:DUF1543 domain-containing protein [Gallaecimonas kandeliae]|uniref:DUF1543 domain-containing protein n=1 Tax=Gallaecimonas kandeliae TaxID=3029055 RepID=UPI00264786F2|nr:DUF1543 domain-containing protein [Gallaecimonas kandeliae]WKE64083.1 DUF1543 domain-containing protein [Gallaecimonas kandeliae]
MLYVVMLGGRHPRAKIEVHDVVFAVADEFEGCFEQLRQQWFGAAKGLHIDSWLAVDGIDEFQVRLSDQAPAPGEPRLYFINLGGYEDGQFGEAHHYLLVVAKDKVEAKAKGKQQLASHWDKPHTDALLDLDDCVPVDQAGGRYVQLLEGPHGGIIQQSDYIILS